MLQIFLISLMMVDQGVVFVAYVFRFIDNVQRKINYEKIGTFLLTPHEKLWLGLLGLGLTLITLIALALALALTLTLTLIALTLTLALTIKFRGGGGGGGVKRKVPKINSGV